MAFHRYVTPTYYGGLPVGYDLINVVSGGTGAGGSAFADGAKGLGNPNTGTYFVAWGEDATSSNANRGLRALAQNTDLLDDLFHRDLARPVRTNDAVAGAPVSTVVLPTNTFLGTAGYTTSVADLARLFSILDDSDNEIIIQATGQKVQVTSVTLGAGDAIGGGGANGSFSGNTVQLNISPSIPTGTTYRIWYADRTNLGTLPVDAFTTIKIRGAEEVSSAVEDLFRLLHGNNLSWNAGWTTTVYDMAASGLYDRYSRLTANEMGTPPESYWQQGLDTSGSGGWIRRTGPALTVYTAGDEAGAYSDPIGALFAAKFIDTAPFDSGGVNGFVVYGARRSGSNTTGESTHEPGSASFLSLWPHHYINTVHATNPYTRIFEGATATLANVGAYNANTGEAVVTVTQAGNYFRTGGGDSAVSLGHDLLEITYTQGAIVKRQVFVIVAHGASNDAANAAKVRVRRLDGSIPDFSATSSVTIRWHSLTFGVGDGAGRYHKTKYAYNDNVSILFDALFYQVPPRLSSSAGEDDVGRIAPGFSAQDNSLLTTALRWGGFSKTSSGPVWGGFLTGDGGISVGGLAFFSSLVQFNGNTEFDALAEFFSAAEFNAGIDVSGGAAAAAGVFVGVNSNPGITTTGHGGAPGLQAFGGSGDGTGLTALGGGTAGNGLSGTGAGAGTGVVAAGGATGIGLFCSGGGGSPALYVSTGNAVFAGAQPAKDADVGFNNYVASTHVAKAWGMVVTDGAGGWTLEDGVNVSNITLGTSYITVTLARPFATTKYAPVPSNANGDGDQYSTDWGTRTTSSFRINVRDAGGLAVNPQTNLQRCAFVVYGRQ